MRQFSRQLLLMLCAISALATADAQQVTTEMIGSLSGGFTVNYPAGPCAGQTDSNVPFAGSVHVVASVDTTTDTVDYHINLLNVKGTGSITNYVASGATDLLGQNFPGANATVLVPFSANLFPAGPCRAGFTFTGAFPIVVRLSFGSDFTLSTVSAFVGVT